MTNTNGGIVALVATIENAAKAYYRGEDSGMTDAEFDALRDRLKSLFPDHPLLKAVGHGFKASNSLKKVRHSTRMGSLDNCFEAGDISSWVVRIAKLCSESGRPVPMSVAVQPKLDGLSVQLSYRDGVLVQAATRGDGAEGEDVMANAKRAKGVPLHLPRQIDVDVRGEMVITKADFKAHFTDTANTRNAAAGTVRRQDGSRSEHLTFIPFDANLVDYDAATAGANALSDEEADAFDNEFRLQALMTSYGFEWALTLKVEFDANKITKSWEKWKGIRETLPYDVDGCVVKVSGRKTATALGWADTCPRSAFAGKWRGGMVAEAEVIGIEHSVGRTGIITPVAKIKPTKCGGTTIENLSLMNWDEVNRIEDGTTGKATLGVGSVVKIERAGDVIPRVIAVLKACKPQDVFGRPEKCPSCGTQTIVDGPRQRCPNGGACPAQGFRWVKSWVAKRNIMFLGDETLDRLMAMSGPVAAPSDLYKITRQQVKEGAGGFVMADKILQQIEKSRDCTVAELFGAVGIEGCGMVESQKVVDHLQAETVDAVLQAGEPAFVAALGPARGSWFAKGVAEYRDEIVALSTLLRVAKPAPKDASKVTKAWEGHTFCATGASELPREALIAIIVAAGGIWKSSVSKNCEYLIIADPSSTSNKAKDARKLGVKLISEADALGMADYA